MMKSRERTSGETPTTFFSKMTRPSKQAATRSESLTRTSNRATQHLFRSISEWRREWGSAGRVRQGRKPMTLYILSMAEGMGFEPMTPVSQGNRLAGGRTRPLCDPSGQILAWAELGHQGEGARRVRPAA